MAKFNASMDASLTQLTQLTDEDKWIILQPAADLAKEAFTASVERNFPVTEKNQKWRTGALAESPVVVQKNKDDTVYALIQLKGKHPNSSTGVRMKKDSSGNRRSSGHYSGSNAEVGYFLNYGTPRIAATHWYENTEEQIEPQVHDKIEDGFVAFMEGHNL